MMNITKKLSFMMMLVCGMSQAIQSNDACDDNGRTPLMNYVIDKEIEIKNAQSDLEKLWDRYFYIEKVYDGCVVVMGQAVVFFKKNIKNKVDTTDENAAEYEKAKNELSLLVQDAIKTVEIMALEGADVSVYDQQGKTVLDYCYTRDIYKALRKFGASSSFETWAYFNPGEIIVNGFLGTVAAIAGVCVYNLYQKAYPAA